MITGDHKATACAIARGNRHLASRGTGSFTGGASLTAMGEAELDRVIDETTVFARVSPSDKLKIVRAFKTPGTHHRHDRRRRQRRPGGQRKRTSA